MPFSALDTRGLARALAQISEQDSDRSDAYLERQELVEAAPEEEAPAVRVWREEGLAVRLVRGRSSWLASRDGVSAEQFADAVRQAARVLPSPALPQPELELPRWEEAVHSEELHEFPSRVERRIRRRHVAFPLRLRLRRHRRILQVVGTEVAAEVQRESFYSWSADLGWSRCGGLLPDLDEAAADLVADALVDRFQARKTAPPDRFRGVVVLGPGAAAVLLHEAVAHALEADLLALQGMPEEARGKRLGARCLNVLDDPTSAPEGVRRSSDDEGLPTARRWLLRDGVVEQPLADAFWAARSEQLLGGAARRADRHHPPAPRSTHLELLVGDAAADDLLAEADGGLWAAEAARGHLNPLTRSFRLTLPAARRIRDGEPGERVGPCTLQGEVGELLERVTALGGQARSAGAGWCAKGEQKLPVWATTPPLRLEGVEVGP